MKSIVSITRSRSELLVAVLSAEAPDTAKLESPKETGSLDFQALYQMQISSMDACKAFLNERQRQLQRSWQKLKSVSAADAETLFHVCIVLLETIPEIEAGALPLPPLGWKRDPDQAICKPTAAHPRAYKGTKYQPPKPPDPEPVDLRPYLCDCRHIQLILTRLRPFRQEIRLRLLRKGYDGEKLDALGMTDVAQKEEKPDVSVVSIGDAEYKRFPLEFRQILLPLLPGHDRKQIKAYLALYWKLQLQENHSLLYTLGHLVQIQNNDTTLHWGDILADLAAEWRIPFACLLVLTQAYKIDPCNLAPAVLNAFKAIEEQPYPTYRLYCLLLCITRDIDTEYLLAGFRLADEFDPDYYFHSCSASGYFPVEAAAKLISYIRPASYWYKEWALSLWKACGRFQGFGRELEATEWQMYFPDVAISYLRLFLDVHWEWTETRDACWKLRRRIKPRLDKFLSQISPDYQQKCLQFLYQCVWEWVEQAEAWERMLAALPLIIRLCRLPFRKHTCGARIVSLSVQYLDVASLEMLRNAPDSSWLRLEEMCVRQNGERLVEAGFYTLLRIVPGWTAQVFPAYAAKLCRTARLLGCFSDGMRDGIVRDFAQTLSSQPKYEVMSLEDACAFLKTAAVPSSVAIIPRQIQEHCAQIRLLDAQRLEHYRGEMNRRFLLAQLEMLERTALHAMYAGFEDYTSVQNKSAVHHAMQMRCHADDNRRGFRKFLRAYLGGEKEYLRLHPRSQAWLRKHPRIREDVWLQGIASSAAVIEGVGTIRLSVETEPLEALRMGTHVESCLGIGGNFAYSAVANMLDINKQVVYAWDEAGRVVARQLVAISEAEQVVCFGVYPYGVSAALQERFRDYDRLWADALGLSLFRCDGEVEYDIANVLSQYWWDDNAWDLEIEVSS